MESRYICSHYSEAVSAFIPPPVSLIESQPDITNLTLIGSCDTIESQN